MARKIPPPTTTDVISTPPFANLCPVCDQSMSFSSQYTAKDMGNEASPARTATAVMALPPKRPIFLLSRKSKSDMFPNEESVEASASPPCLSGPIRARLKPRFRRKATKAVQTGVVVSLSA